uniref:Polycystin cation channel PKD1/PKD2 domain-containing protein n=1 Tax=Hanusia phi TaxID=3032 RepID=A0A7S0HNZ8_9CRYP|mmetsp:Transcript_29889/g.67626  ORF Transcript_29889/g.67626 Transcript_29889/m.67626 type:complete len:684 (+) Transcript_29889:19-2070(+)
MAAVLIKLRKEEEEEEAQGVRARRRKLVDMSIYCLFLFLITSSSLLLYPIQDYHELQSLGAHIATTEPTPTVSFHHDLLNVSSVNDMWRWLLRVFPRLVNIPSFNASASLAMPSQLMLQSPRLRQVRVNKRACDVPSRMSEHAVAPDVVPEALRGQDECIGNVAESNIDRSPFRGVRWNGSHAEEEVLLYRSASELLTYPFTSMQSATSTTYEGGGFVVELPREQTGKVISSVLAELQRIGWVDDKSKAIFVSWAVYDTLENIASSSLLLFELRDSGSVRVVKSFRSTRVVGFSSFITGETGMLDMRDRAGVMLDLLLLLITVLSVLSLPLWLFRSARSKPVSSHSIDVLIVLLLTTMLGFKIAKWSSCERLLSGKQDWMDFEYLGWLDKQITNFLCLVVIFSWLRGLEYLKEFSAHIDYISNTFALCKYNMLSMSFLLAILLFGFATAFHVSFGSVAAEYKNIFDSFTTAFKSLLVGVSFDDVLRDNPVLGGILALLYTSMCVLILLTVFTTIISDAYDQTSKRRISQSTPMQRQLLSLLKVLQGKWRKPPGDGKQQRLVFLSMDEDVLHFEAPPMSTEELKEGTGKEIQKHFLLSDESEAQSLRSRLMTRRRNQEQLQLLAIRELEDWTLAELAEGPLPVRFEAATTKMANMSEHANKIELATTELMQYLKHVERVLSPAP